MMPRIPYLLAMARPPSDLFYSRPINTILFEADTIFQGKNRALSSPLTKLKSLLRYYFKKPSISHRISRLSHLIACLLMLLTGMAGQAFGQVVGASEQVSSGPTSQSAIARTITGTVRRNGVSVAGAIVTIERITIQPPSWYRCQAITAADGTYSFAMPPDDGRYEVYTTLKRVESDNFSSRAVTTVQVSSLSTFPSVDLSFRDITLHGTVFKDGNPVSSQYTVYRRDNNNYRVTTANDGTYTLPLLAGSNLPATIDLAAFNNTDQWNRTVSDAWNSVQVTSPSMGNVNFAFTTVLMSATVTANGARAMRNVEVKWRGGDAWFGRYNPVWNTFTPYYAYTNNVTLGGVFGRPVEMEIRAAEIGPMGDRTESSIITRTLPSQANESVSFDFIKQGVSISDIRNCEIEFNHSTDAIPFLIGSWPTPPTGLTMSVASSNTALVPTSGIVLGGSGANRTVRVSPTPNAIGSAIITVTVSDGTYTDSDQFTLTVFKNTPPTIGHIADRTIGDNHSTGPIYYNVQDAETDTNLLWIHAESSNQALITLDTGYLLATNYLPGFDVLPQINLTPNRDAIGSTVITITVSDERGAAASESFVITVIPVDDPPAISDLVDQYATIGNPIAPLTFTVSDNDTPVTSLRITAISSNPTLVPVAGIVFAGAGDKRTLTIKPAAGQTGTAIITVTVSDGISTASTRFTVTIGAIGVFGDGLAATYFDNIDFTGRSVQRIDPQVNFSWGYRSPDKTIGVDTFSARWSGQVMPAFSETYTFYTTSNEGIRLFVNGVRIINNWRSHTSQVNTGTIALTAGVRADILLEYYENTGWANVMLEWSSPSRKREVVPQYRLFSNPVGIGALFPREQSGVEALALWSVPLPAPLLSSY